MKEGDEICCQVGGAGRRYGEGSFFLLSGMELEQCFSTVPRVSEQLC